MKNAYLLYNFNPYHNRQIKRFETVQEYIDTAESYFIDSRKRNFAYNDGVQTSIDVYTKDNLTVLDNQDNPDYLILTDEKTPNEIDSRWFVIDTTKRCGNMYTLTLRRDLVSDSYEKILDCPAYIEKATLSPADPFIFNQENIAVNRIKAREVLLKDKSNCAWIVGYLAPDAITADTVISGGPNRAVDYSYNSEASFLLNPIAQNSEFTNVDAESSLPTSANTPVDRADKYRIDIAYVNGAWTDGYRAITARWKPNEPISIFDNETGYASEAALYTALPGITTALALEKNTIWANIWANTVTNALNEVRSSISAEIDSYQSVTFDNPLQAYDGKTWKIGDKYYKSSVITKQNKTIINQTLSTQDDTPITEKVLSLDWTRKSAATLKSIRCGYDVKTVVLQFTEISSGTIEATLKATDVALNNIPYKMFAIPYRAKEEITIRTGINQKIVMPGDLGIILANEISKKYSGVGSLYDLQLLPYCPVQDIVGNNELNLPKDAGGNVDNTRFTYITDGDIDDPQNIGIIYWVTENTFTFDIDYELNIENPKLESIIDMYRLSSPNWNGQFEFNAAKNGGIKYFNVDCTYKPFTPYIHINPNFGRLYGADFDDARGLICAGDFSLPQIYDQWQTYELQNKNYQNQFNRQIENMEFTQGIAMKKQQMAVITGAASGALSGAMTGASLGGGTGAVIGGLVGGAASIAGGMQDLYYQKQLNKEAIDYTVDQFVMSNENIQALPDSLKQVGALTANNKIFPVLEYYTCTPEEREAVILKLRYNGSTVERIGTIREFLREEESYIKCKLIRINMLEDNHFIEALADELNKGVFIK